MQYYDNYVPAPVSSPVMMGRASYYANQYQSNRSLSRRAGQWSWFDETERIVDVSFAAAESLGLILSSSADVQAEVLG